MEIGIVLPLVLSILVFCLALWRFVSIDTMLTFLYMLASFLIGGFLELKWKFMTHLLVVLGIS